VQSAPSPRNRTLIWLGNDELQIAVARGGGHIAALHLPKNPSSINPYWEPPWRSLEPEEVSGALVDRDYGGAPEGRLLASVLGHNLALDLYGPPSEQEVEAGLVTHGMIGVLPWTWEQRNPATLVGNCRDPIAQVEFSRKLQVRGSSVLIEESLTNLCAWDRPFAWQQHVSLGPPFLEDGFWAESNSERGATHPQSFGPGASLIPGTETDWPYAPRRSGFFLDYRKPLEADSVANDFTGYQVSRRDELGNFVAGNSRFGFALFYLWPRHFFPWMGIWDERHARAAKPWEKRASVRAYEFGVSPHPMLRRELLASSRLFDTPTYLILPARQIFSVRYVLGVFAHVHEAGKLVVSGDQAVLTRDEREISRVTLPGQCSSSMRWEMRA